MMHSGGVEVKLDKKQAIQDTASEVQHNVVHLSRGQAILWRMQNSISNARTGIDNTEAQEKMMHMIPKVFFFMIPLMALVLHLLFLRRRELLFVNHAIFALNYHSLWFSIMILSVLYPFDMGYNLVQQLLTLGTAIYFVIALKNVYNTGWIKAIVYSVITALVYMVFVLLSLVVLVSLVF